MKFTILPLVAIAVATLVGCGSIQNTSTIKTAGMKVGNSVIATRGDAILEIINKESMPNAFGAADIFGRTRPTGTTSLIYVGGDGNIANFIRRDISIHSDKTTMNSSPLVIPRNSSTSFSGQSGGTRFSGTANTYSAPIFLPPNTPEDSITGVREIPISVSVRSGENRIVLGGVMITVLSATTNELRYTVQ